MAAVSSAGDVCDFDDGSGGNQTDGALKSIGRLRHRRLSRSPDGHSMGGVGHDDLGGKYNDIWAGTCPTLGGRGHRRRRRGTVQVTAHADHARRQGLDCACGDLAPGGGGAAGRRRPHIYIEFPDQDDEFWIGAAPRTWRKCSSSSAWCRSGPQSFHRSSGEQLTARWLRRSHRHESVLKALVISCISVSAAARFRRSRPRSR